MIVTVKSYLPSTLLKVHIVSPKKLDPHLPSSFGIEHPMPKANKGAEIEAVIFCMRFATLKHFIYITLSNGLKYKPKDQIPKNLLPGKKR